MPTLADRLKEAISRHQDSVQAAKDHAQTIYQQGSNQQTGPTK